MTIPFNPTANPVNPFRMPDGYIDDFTSRLMARIPEPQEAAKPVRRTLWQTLRPYLSAAAVIAVVAIGTKTLQQRKPAMGYANNTQTAEATVADNAIQDELYTYLMLDDQSLYTSYDYEQ